MAPVAVRGEGDALVIVLAIGPAAPALDAEQDAALDLVARLVRDDPGRRVAIRYTDPSGRRDSESWSLAGRAEDRLLVAGVEPERIVRVRVRAVPGASAPSAVEVAVTRIR